MLIVALFKLPLSLTLRLSLGQHLIGNTLPGMMLVNRFWQQCTMNGGAGE